MTKKEFKEKWAKLIYDLADGGVGEADDLVLDRGAVADAGAHDGTAVESGIIEVFADDLVGLGSGVG